MTNGVVPISEARRWPNASPLGAMPRGRHSWWRSGPDGLDASIRTKAELILSFGAATLPHGLVRVLALEQLYRSLTILSGHPYHRGEAG